MITDSSSNMVVLHYKIFRAFGHRIFYAQKKK